jgi:hypothetical protein
MPVPGPGRDVIFPLDVRHEADYRVSISSPTVKVPGEKQVGCQLEISVKPGNGQTINKRNEWLADDGQAIGWHLDEFKGDAVWHIPKGLAEIQISGTDNCNDIILRGGTLSLYEDVVGADPTGLYLLNQLKIWLPRLSAALGLVILIGLQVREAVKQRRKAPGATA